MDVGPHCDRRRFKRTPTRMPVTLLVEPDRNRLDLDAPVVDSSQQGLRVRVDTALTPGATVWVIPNTSSGYNERCRVVWIRKASTDNEGEAGLEFVNPIPAFT
jgi:hypothetical protein